MRHIFFLKKDSFNEKKNEIPDSALCFIKDTNEIWTHLTLFSGPPLEVQIAHTSTGIINDSQLIKEGYVLVNYYGMKDNKIYPVIRLNNSLSVVNITTKTIVAAGGSNILTYDIIEDSDIILIFNKIT